VLCQASATSSGMTQEAIAVLAYRRFLGMTSPGLVASAVLVAAHNLVTSTVPKMFLSAGRDQLFCISFVLQDLPGRYYPDTSDVSWLPPCEASMVPGLGPVPVTGGPMCPEALPSECQGTAQLYQN